MKGSTRQKKHKNLKQQNMAAKGVIKHKLKWEELPMLRCLWHGIPWNVDT
jgi:hypothetical protein